MQKNSVAEQLSLNERSKQSVSRRDSCLDKEVAGNLFGHFNEELPRGRRHISFDQFRRHLVTYVHLFHNERIRELFGGHSPVNTGSSDFAGHVAPASECDGRTR